MCPKLDASSPSSVSIFSMSRFTCWCCLLVRSAISRDDIVMTGGSPLEPICVIICVFIRFTSDQAAGQGGFFLPAVRRRLRVQLFFPCRLPRRVCLVPQRELLFACECVPLIDFSVTGVAGRHGVLILCLDAHALPVARLVAVCGYGRISAADTDARDA